MGGSVRSTCDTDNHFNLILKIQTQHERSSMKRGEGKGERFNALIKRINTYPIELFYHREEF